MIRPPPAEKKKAAGGDRAALEKIQNASIIYLNPLRRQCSQCQIPCHGVLCDQCAGLMEAAQFIRRAAEVLRGVR